ncbi:MAG TPA: hypothetical protein DHN33_05325, partial [Eubacteriaceae bacterium]|nr:hypothetical protein [Eubacteriaceae bacterium]
MTNSNNKQFSSKALEVNLSETRKDTAEIPDIQQWFGEISRSQWGVYKRTQEFLKELNHKYRNNQYVIESLHTICLGDLWIYNEHEESEKALGVIVDIIRSILQSSIEVGQRELMIQIILRFMDRLVKLGDFPENIIFECLDLMRADMKNHELLYIRNSGYFKSYLDKVVEYPAFEKEILELTESVIDRSISYWEKTSKAEEWFQARKSLFHHMDQETIAQIGKPFFDQLKKEKAKATDWKSLTSLMFYNDISNYFRSFTEKFDSHLEAIYYLFYLLHLPGMTYLSDHLLYDMNRNLRNIFVDLNNEDTIDFINGIMNEFEELKENHGSTVLDCIVTLGKEIIATDDSKNIDHFVKSLIKLGFHYPGKVTLTDDWQIQINSNHIKNIRIWLELIECNPKQTQELLAALIIHLKLGGVFISDTDLFQRDVTQLLNADISPVYREMKQLARIFPVYFREIGAEGTLRDVTTALDEFSLRKDRLIHFLRKQVHTESNNTHIELCERIILFWAYGNKDRIKDLVPDDVYESIDFESKWFVLPHHTLESLAKDLSKTPEELLDYDLEIIERTLNKLPEKSVPDAKRVYDLFHVHTL